MNKSNIFVKLASMGFVTMIIMLSIIFNSQCQDWYQNLERTTCRVTNKKIMIVENPNLLDQIYQRYPWEGILEFTMVGPDTSISMSKSLYKSFDKDAIKNYLQRFPVGKDIDCFYLKDGSYKKYIKNMYTIDDVYFDPGIPYFHYIGYILILIYIVWMTILEIYL